MSQSNKKILVSGCGISWSQQQHRTWVNVLQSLAVDCTDVAGPAISNQTIVNRVVDCLLDSDQFDAVVVQLTSAGKLDVEITPERQSELVDSDPIRNFTHQGVWPSSHSLTHPAKASWHKWLYSPTLELQDLCQKLVLLSHWCLTHQIQLIVIQGYHIPWTAKQHQQLEPIITDIDQNIYNWYQTSSQYQHYDCTNHNTVPGIEFQIELAEYFLTRLGIDHQEKIKKLKQFYQSKRQ